MPAAGSGTLTIGGDLIVNRLGFGAMRLTGDGIWGEPKDPAEARRVLQRAVALGVNFIDTADAYGPEVSERLIAEALHPYPAGLVIATKGGLTRPGPDQWQPDGRPEHLRAACEASLMRLKLQRIDLYQFHRSTRRCRSRTRSGNSRGCSRRARYATWAYPTSRWTSWHAHGGSCPWSRCRTATTFRPRLPGRAGGVCARGLAFIPWAPIARGSTARLEKDNGGEGLRPWPGPARSASSRQPSPGSWPSHR